MGANERLVDLKESGGVSKFAKPTIEETDELLVLMHKLAT